jgi:adenine-specific DNA-methyltransferase
MIQDWLQGKDVYDLKGQKIEGFFFKENGRLYSKKRMETVSIKSVLRNIPDTQGARKEIASLYDGNEDVFSYPKTIEIPKLFAKLVCNKDDIIFDFFSGSGTSAHALMQLNSEDKGQRKYILVQLPEIIDKNSESYKLGFRSICDIGEDRIRRAGKKIKEETGADIDYGFRCFKVDSSNMKDVYYRPAELGQLNLDQFTDNIKEDRTPEDLLIQVMLDLGVLLSSKVEQTEIAEKKVFSVQDGYLIACFDNDVTEDVVTAIAKKHPFYAVFRDSSIADDSVAANFEQIFETYSPQTVRKVL